MIYLALGDSITHGYNASDESRNYVSLLVEKLNRLKRTSAHVHAKPGWTASQLVSSLQKVPACILQEAELITVMVGGNDLLRAMPWYLNDVDAGRERLHQSFAPAMREILSRASGRPGAKRFLCTVYNPFPEWDLARVGLDDLNVMIGRAAREHACHIVPIHQSYAGREWDLVDGYRGGQSDDFRLMRNPIHPNDRGHVLLAEELFARYEQLSRRSKGQNSPRKRRARGKAARTAALSRRASMKSGAKKADSSRRHNNANGV